MQRKGQLWLSVGSFSPQSLGPDALGPGVNECIMVRNVSQIKLPTSDGWATKGGRQERLDPYIPCKSSVPRLLTTSCQALPLQGYTSCEQHRNIEHIGLWRMPNQFSFHVVKYIIILCIVISHRGGQYVVYIMGWVHSVYM